MMRHVDIILGHGIWKHDVERDYTSYVISVAGEWEWAADVFDSVKEEYTECIDVNIRDITDMDVSGRMVSFGDKERPYRLCLDQQAMYVLICRKGLA